MELGRRNFVQLLGAAAYSVATSSVSRVTLAAVEYRNAALGFALGKPSEWFYLSYEEYSQAGAELDNAEAVGDLRDSMGEPVVTIAKYCETPPVATPSISVFAEAPGWNATEADLFDFDFSPFADTLQDFHLEEDAEPDSLAGLTASRSAYSYRISSSSGESARLPVCQPGS